MSCNDSNARQVPTPPIDHRARHIIIAEGDYEIQSQLVDQVHITEPEGATTSAKVTLPANPLLGQSHKIVATGAGVNMDGNGNPVLAGNTFVPQGTVAEFVFTENPDENPDDCSCQGGAWASCCATTPEPVVIP